MTRVPLFHGVGVPKKTEKEFLSKYSILQYLFCRKSDPILNLWNNGTGYPRGYIKGNKIKGLRVFHEMFHMFHF